MSIHRIELNVFRFDAKRDFTPVYEKCEIEYKQDFKLSDILKSIPLFEFEYEEYIALKLNKIAIFEDLLVSDLVEEFGKNWILDPISLKYAYKDLKIDRDSALKFYSRFFESAKFLSVSEKNELIKYININFISPQKNPEYFGDGFFLYSKWLLNRYPNEAKKFLNSIGDQKNGIMNFVSVKNFIYPRSDRIDMEIFELQKMLTQGSKCPISGSKWVKLAKKINKKYKFSSLQAEIKNTDNKHIYTIFNGYDKEQNSAPLLISSKNLLERLNKEVLELKFCFDGGYWGRFGDEENFFFANAYNLALAYKNNATLVFAEEDSYTNAMYAKKELDSNAKLLENINKKLEIYHLNYSSSTKIEYLNKMIIENLSEDEIRQNFDGFSTIIFNGSFAFEAQKVCYKDFFEKISLKRHSGIFKKECYYHLKEISNDSALFQSGAIRYEGIDLGCDFLVSLSQGQFEMFDTYSKKASKKYRRDFDPTPVLFLSQIALIALGEKDSRKLGIDLHKNKITFI